MELSKSDQNVLEAFKKGYRVENNEVVNKDGNKRVLTNQENYKAFSIRVNGRPKLVRVHRLLAYQKYGGAIFDKKINVRHLNGDAHCNFEHNIVTGSRSDNMMDRLPEDRLNHALKATNFIRKYSHQEVIEYRNQGHSYKQIMEKFQISSKGTVSFIINNSFYSKN